MTTPEHTLDLSRWSESPLGVMHRRWVMVSTGLRHLLRTRFFRGLVFLAWSLGFGLAAAGFLFTQSIATGGWLDSLAADQGPRVQAVVSAFTALVLLYPDILIGGMFTLLFWAHAQAGLLLSLVALSALVPNLITRDRASNALAIYLSRPITSLDYLLGKFGIVVGVLVLVWTGPLLFAWTLSMLVSPDMDFVVYSLEPLGRALLFNGIGLATLAPIALGVSSLARSSRVTAFVWIAVWIIAGGIARFPTTPDWMRAASFSYNLSNVHDLVFNLPAVLSKAAQSLPMLSADIATGLNQMADQTRIQSLDTAVIGLPMLVALSLFLLFRRLRLE